MINYHRIKLLVNFYTFLVISGFRDNLLKKSCKTGFFDQEFFKGVYKTT